MDSRLGIPPLLRSAIAGVLLPLHLAACTSWRTATVLPSGRNLVRVVTIQGPSVELRNATATTDSIIGWQGKFRLALPRSTVDHIEVQQTNPGQTVVLVVFVLFSAALVFGIALQADPITLDN